MPAHFVCGFVAEFMLNLAHVSDALARGQHVLLAPILVARRRNGQPALQELIGACRNFCV